MASSVAPRNIVLVGVGALGSHVLLLARNWGVTIKVIDFDRVEQKNVASQFHTKMSLGRNKAQACQQAMLGMYGLKIEAVPHKLTDQNSEQLLKGADLVIDCTDNVAAREVIQTHVKKTGIPCLHGSVSAEGDFARVVWTEHFKPDAEGVEGQATCEDGVQLPFFCLASSYIAQEAQRFLKGGTKRSFMVTPMAVLRIA